ncbi:MAG: hypothetical protein H8D97_00975 [Proteobacteria bacterium]|nr:hypothetical protein [Pseudomonadota bacterium]
MKEQIKLKNIFDIEKFRLIADDSLLTKTEKEMILYPRNSKNVEKYEKFDTDFMIYLMKVPNSPGKKFVDRLFNNKLIFFGTDSKQNGTFGGPLIVGDDKLAGICLDGTDLDIALMSGETSNIDLCFYASYFNYIRGTVLIKRKELKQDTEFNNLVVSYLKNIIKKAINIPTLGPKQEIIYEALVRQFYYQFMLFYEDFNFAMEFTMKEVLPEFKDEVQEVFRTNEMNKYGQFRDIFKALYDLKLVMDSPNKMMMNSLNKFGISQFLYITTVIDYLIASIILANYPGATFTKNLFVSRKNQEQVEAVIAKFGSTIRFSYDGTKGL